MKKASRHTSATRAKLFVAAISVGLAWGVASALPETSSPSDGWRLRVAVEEPVRYLDASGRRVDFSEPALRETTPTTLVETTTVLADSSTPRETPVGATLDDPEPLAGSFPPAEEASENARAQETDWAVVDEDEEKRRDWSRELRLEEFAEPSFVDVEAPTWRDDVSIVFATYEELEALPSGANVLASNLASPALRKLATNASAASGYYAETASVTEANAEQAQAATSVPARVGVFAACGTFEANGVAKTRVH